MKFMRWVTLWVVGMSGSPLGLALDVHKSLANYSRTVWTRQNGLPEDDIQAIAQTEDGYLWFGTHEGLARFDGYEFVTFTRDDGDLPSNAITALAAGADGTLWIGTSAGLVQHKAGKFQTYSSENGMPKGSVTSLFVDQAQTVWIVAGDRLVRFDGGGSGKFEPLKDLPPTPVRGIVEDRAHNLYVAAFDSLYRLENGRLVSVIPPSALRGKGTLLPSGVFLDRTGNLWVLSTRTLMERLPNGEIRDYPAGGAAFLAFAFFRGLWEDRDGDPWAWTDDGLARLDGDKFQALHQAEFQRLPVKCLFQDREGNLWVGSSNGLTRFRDDPFTMYGRLEGLPSDEPNTVYHDRSGRTWIGFVDKGLTLLDGGGTSAKLIAPGSVYAIRESPSGELLAASRDGLIRYGGGQAGTWVPPDPLGRRTVWDVLPLSDDRILLGVPGGLGELRGDRYRVVLAGSPPTQRSVVTLAQGENGAVWAGTIGDGLWQVGGAGWTNRTHYTTADGLGTNQIRSLYLDPEKTLWIGTADGGLNSFHAGKFTRFRVKDGLLSDNVSTVVDDGESLWLSTPRGICKVSKHQLRDFSEGRVARLEPVNYGVADGLRSEQSSPQWGAGGGRHRDGSLWFVTNRGVAVYAQRAPKQLALAPMIHILDAEEDGRRVSLTSQPKIAPGVSRLGIRYTSIHLRAPEQVSYSYKLDGLDADWIPAGAHRFVDYTRLRHGRYLFHVRATLPDGVADEASLSFEVLPHFYETTWFQLACAAGLLGLGWLAYQFRLRQIRSAYDLVLQERLRLAREIHDTLTQAFVGISSQLDALQRYMPEDAKPARQCLALARRMARHSLTEANRSVMDLRASELVGTDLAAALEEGARLWSAGSSVDVKVTVRGAASNLGRDVEQNVLRIAQEAVTNVLKHAEASRIGIDLELQPTCLNLKIEDDGHGFEKEDIFVGVNGHFGLIGMRERAARMGGEFQLDSQRGKGTRLEVTVPLA